MSSSGQSAIQSRYRRSTGTACSIGQNTAPAMTCGPSGCSRNRKSVTTPKLPPPPRRPQNRSAFSSTPARTNSPSAVTRSADSSESTVKPNFRMIQPIPPPSVRPASPV